MSEQTPDDFLLSLDHGRTRRLARAQRFDLDEKSSKSAVPDGDQGALGIPPGPARPRRSKDAFLMEITDAGRHGGDGVAPPEWYDEAYGE